MQLRFTPLHHIKNQRNSSNWMVILMVSLLILPFLMMNALKMHRKLEVNNMIHGKLLTEEVIIMKFTKTQMSDEIQWIAKDEFFFKDKMYDVIYSYVIGEATYLLVLDDEEERQINNMIKSSLDSCNGTASKPESHKKKTPLMLYCMTVKFYDEIVSNFKEQNSFSFKPVVFREIYLDILLPPPEKA